MGGGAAAGPRGRGRGGPPFPRSVGGAPGLRRRHHQLHGPRGPPPATGGGARGGALPLAKGRRTRRAHPHSAPESGAEKLPPPPRRRRLPPGSLPDSPTGEGSRHSGLRPPPRPGRRRHRRAGGGAETSRGRSPTALHPTHWPARRGVESLLKPPRLLPRGRAGGGRGAGRGGRRRHVPPEPVRPHFLSPVPQLCPVPNSAPTFSSLVPTLPGPHTQPSSSLWVLDSGSSPSFSANALPAGIGREQGS